jgi:4-coumarate--CoA ligase
VLGVFSPNDVDYSPCVYGALWAGGVIAPANPAYGAKDLAFMLENSGAKALVAQKSLLKVALEAAKLAGLRESSIILIGDDGAGNTDASHFKNLAQPTRRQERPCDLNPDVDLAFLAYSSGTTGLPKGVMLSHKNIVSDVLMVKHSVGTEYSWQNDKILAVLPFFHIYGLTGTDSSCHCRHRYY